MKNKKPSDTKKAMEVALTTKEISLPEVPMVIPKDTTIVIDRMKQEAYYMGVHFTIMRDEYLLVQ